MGRMLRNFAGVTGRSGARRMQSLDIEAQESVREPSDGGSSRCEPLLRSRDDDAAPSSRSNSGSEGRERPLLLRLADERTVIEQGGRTNEETLGTWMDASLSAMSLTLANLLPGGMEAALESPVQSALSYDKLKQFLATTDLFSVLGLGHGARVAVCVQNGAQLAASILTTISLGCCCPLDPNSPEAELRRDFTMLRVEAVLVDAPGGAGANAALEQGLACAQLIPDPFIAGLFSLRLLFKGTPRTASMPRDDTVLVLSTSGTTGRKKTVPYTLRTLVTGAGCIIKSWDLQPEDVCMNMMPLIHIGGIARNLLGTLLSGGRLLCYPFFDPVAFWAGVEERDVTWYYGSPAMHRSIVEEGKQRPQRPIHLRMICNAAGGLPPALCNELHDRFHCSVLPSYGMSECMPISSPPSNFNESAPKTSGLPCGPEVAIMDDGGKQLAPSKIGNICVRGPPTMAGYESKEHNEGAWFGGVGGWFITGDLGYLSEGGWLYVTGRTKEVIKRGGETVSPVEIEEAVLKHEDVIEAAAFGIKDSALGENIAIALVLKPGPRVGLPRLRAFLKEALRPALLPQALVYCVALPKTSTGKIRRAWISQACRGVVISQDTSWRDRVFTAKLSSQVRSAEEIEVQPMNTRSTLADQALQPVFTQTRTVFSQDGKLRITYGIDQVSRPCIREALSNLDDIDKPDAVVQLQEFPSVLPSPKPPDFLDQVEFEAPETREEIIVASIWASVLQRDESTISATSDFFEVGGTSLLAGKVASELRLYSGKIVPTHMVFSSPKLRDLARAIAASPAQAPSPDAFDPESTSAETPLVSHDPDHDKKMPSSIGLHILFIQLLPCVVLPVLSSATQYTLFLYSYNYLSITRLPWSKWVLAANLNLNWYAAMMSFYVFSGFVLPIFAILTKWLLVGRLRPGRYPIWGHVYLRWWLAHQTMNFCGQGFFRSNQFLHRLRLRLLGASIRGSCMINYEAGERFIEGDLLTMEEGVLMDASGLKCAALDSGYLVLAPIILERHSSVCTRTVIVPGTVFPAEASLGPATSSHELQDADDDMRRFNKFTFADPHWCLCYMFGYPLHFFIKFMAWLPWLLILQYVVTSANWVSSDDSWFSRALHSLTEPHRIAWWLLAIATKDIVSPIIYMMCVVSMKWLVVGRFEAGFQKDTEWEKFRYWFMSLILSKHHVQEFVSIVGPHYQPTTWLFRALGATVGERVFWPGTPLVVVEFDLLEIGDDVTFGSRTIITCSDAYESQKVRILRGSMVADNCLLLPGTTLGENAILGSGSVGSGDYPANSMSIGNIRGSAVQLMVGAPQDSTIRPFGRAMYQGDAPYCVMTWPFICLINVVCRVIWAPISHVRGATALLAFRLFHPYAKNLRDALPSLFLVYVGLHMSSCILSVLMDVSLKWLLLGRRQPGIHAWDTSSFCQRWKLYVSLRETLHGRSHMLYFLGGSWWIVLYYRLLGATIGRNVCLYPWGASPMMTEPDLTTIGDSVCVENASLVAHTNAMGVYQLHTLNVGNGCTMRDHSRLMAGAEMRPGSKLLEHSLAMSGDVVPEGTAWQGWPNRWQGPARTTPSTAVPPSGQLHGDVA